METTIQFCTSCGGEVPFLKGHLHCIECEKHDLIQSCIIKKYFYK